MMTSFFTQRRKYECRPLANHRDSQVTPGSKSCYRRMRCCYHRHHRRHRSSTCRV